MDDQGTNTKVRILVIDDEPVVGDALKVVLESAGYEVVVVEEGLEGIRLARSPHFSIGIIDLFLADISGLQVIKTIREQQPGIMLILMTGQGSPQAFSEARQLGVVGILAKPFSTAEVLQLISRSLVQ